MKRIITLLMILLVSLYAFADAVWYQNTTEDALNVFNLNNVYYLPMRSSTWGSNSASSGTINESNYIGQLGVSNCSHQIKYTVSTSGSFVSQSDTTKYRDFCIAMCPRYEYLLGDNGFFWDVETNKAVNSSERAPNTRNTGTASVTSPYTNNTNVYVSSGTRRRIQKFWIDLVICMDTLNSDDLKHISENDDYIATITLEWSCKTSNCNQASHKGSYTFILRGYFGDSSAAQDAVYMFVIPSASSTNMSIRDIIQNGEKKIADIQVHTNTRTDTSRYSTSSGRCPGYEWKDHVFTFISASPSYATSDNAGFLLKKKNNPTVTIPYTLNVRSSDGSLNRTFDGTDYYYGSTAAQKKAYCINLGNYSTSTDRYGNTYNTIDFYGYVAIDIDDPTGAISSNAGGIYSGVYESYIYYHIIYE